MELQMTLFTVHTTSPTAIARVAAIHGHIPSAVHDRLTGDQVEAINDEVDRKALAGKLEDMRQTLRRLFLRGMEFGKATSTPKVPTTYRLNVAAESESTDRFETRVRMEPVTAVAYEMLETKGGADDHLHLLLASPNDIEAMRKVQLQGLATEYADAEAAALVDAGWSEQ
jgi:hypothetical protein